MEASIPPNQKSQNPMKCSSTSKKTIYNARFVKENFGDRHKVNPREIVTKEWTFRNNGDNQWPADTLFIQTNGDNLEAAPFKLLNQVKPGEEITISLELVAPELPGKYCAFFRFVCGDN